MISEDIARAKQAKQERLVIGLIIVLVLMCLVVALFYGINHMQWESEESTSSESTAETASPTAPLTEEENKQLRQAYLDAFARYETSLKPELAKIDINTWNKPLADTLQQQEDEAIAQFGQGKYLKAKQAIDKLISTAEKTLTDSQQAFGDAMQQAETAYKNDDYAKAKLAIDTALMHQATSTAAEALAEKIEQIPKIVELKQAIQTAKVENDAMQELSLIEQLLDIAPEQEEMQQRANVLRKQLAERRFDRAIKTAYSAIESEQVESAKKSLEQAKKIYPSRPEISQVASALAGLESQLRFNKHKTAAAAAEKTDDWQRVEQQITLALNERPTDKALIDKRDQAKSIVSLDQSVQSFLQSPYRLSNPAVKTSAEAAVKQARSFSNDSPSLAVAAQKLSSTITAVNTPVSVQVISDGKTFVSVRGVGKVGETTAKTIQLTPGKYTFEGKREGFRSKLLEVVIPMNSPSYQLSIIADERI